MAGLAIELGLEGLNVTQDANKRGSATRRFRYPYADPFAAIKDANIPPKNSPHPQDSTYMLDSYGVSTATDGTTTVDCFYSNDKRYRMQSGPNKNAENYYHWGWGQRNVRVDLPIAVRESTIFAGSTTPVRVWRVNKLPRTEVRIVRILSLRYVTGNTRAFDPIATQTNKLHYMPDGAYYLLESGTTTRVDDLSFDVTYTFVRDDGTLNQSTTGEDTARFLQRTGGSPNPFPDLQFYRPPFNTMAVIPIGDPISTPPAVQLFLQYPLSQNGGKGWQTLPGANILI